MGNCNDNKNPLQLNGTSQPQRLLPSLQPASAPLIGKEPIDWMVWSSRLAAYFKFFNTQMQQEGSMAPFFADDIAARLAMIATHPLDAISDFTREQILMLTETSNSSKTALLRRSFTSLFDILLGYVKRVDETLIQLEKINHQKPGLLLEIDFLFQLNNHLKLRLIPLLSRTIAYYKAAKTANLLEATSTGLIDIFNQPISNAETVIAEGLSKAWVNGQPDWNTWFNAQAEEPSVLGTAATVSGKIQHAAHHNFFTGLLDEASASAAFLIATARQSINRLLTQWPHHEPQYTLFLAWLHLLENAREDMNQLTARHLEFYYEKVLQLRRHPQLVDAAFVCVELNKAASKASINKGTAFIGGKDSNGTEIVYTAQRNTVVNKAAVAAMQSIYQAGENDVLEGIAQTAKMFASPVANSADGLGKKLETPVGEWHPFYNKTYSNGQLASIDMPTAVIGFAISSHYLSLAEGKRKILLKLDVNNNSLLVNKQVAVFVTTPKGWLELGSLGFSAGKMNDGTTNGVLLTINIGADKPAISSYVPKVHNHFFNTTTPVLKIVLLNNLASNAATLNDLAGLKIERIDLEVQVGELTGAYNNEGLKNLLLQNDAGVINAAKPFQPFGNEPTPGNALIIGSEELFSKPNTKIQLNLEWKDKLSDRDNLVYKYSSSAKYQSLPTTNTQYFPAIDFQSLEAGNWVTKSSNLNCFPSSGDILFDKYSFYTQPLSGNLFTRHTEPYQPFGPKTTNGFIRLKLKHDFGHRNYRNAHSWYLIEKGGGNTEISEPAAPYNPVLQSLVVSYNAQCSWVPGSANSVISLWHVAPFGDAASSDSGVSLLPALVQQNTPAKMQASLLIGLSGLQSTEPISLLFQLLEGTENPLQAKPKNHLHWFYLSNNEWKPFGENAVDDGTSQLINSGIVQMVMPDDATAANTIQLAGLHWIKLQVYEAPDAVCKILGIYANAVLVKRALKTGQQMEALMLPAGSIARLHSPDGLVKKVTQPFASFGGRGREVGDSFYVRISERLKHKDRAVTIWDYERLVLQSFPEIYKVKCLNHTRITGSVADGNLKYNEVAPGYVSIITIPSLKQRNDADPLKPYTKKSTLLAIEKFLQARTSCHVQVAAVQPQFEEIRMAAKVVLVEGFTDVAFYREQLQLALTAFLSPWAFDQTANVDFGGNVHKSVLIDFLEELPYVDYLTEVQLFHTPGEGALESGDVEEVEATTARSVLVSAAASKHLFNVSLHSPVSAQKVNCKDA